MRILVTGLCMSSNLGGPAMALTFKEQIETYFKDVKLKFAVPPNSFEEEKKWASHYGLDIVKAEVLPLAILEKFKILNFLNFIKGVKNEKHGYWTKIFNDFLKYYNWADCSINLSGISYVGDSAYKPFQGLANFTFFYYAKKTNTPFIRFIQTFGPFNKFEMRFFAKKEFENLDLIFAKGKETASYCKKLIKNSKKVLDFPDIAILLKGADENLTTNYLNNINYLKEEYVIVSPSYVIYKQNQKVGKTTGKNYVTCLVKICEEIICKKKLKIMFLPHTYGANSFSSDLGVCREIIKDLNNKQINYNYHLVVHNFDVREAKSLIANSKLAIVSRYHALVAALSSSTPALALGWNIKYLDLLTYYKCEDCSIDVRDSTTNDVFEKAKIKIDAIDFNLEKKKLNFQHKISKKKVDNGFVLLSKWISKSTNLENSLKK